MLLDAKGALRAMSHVCCHRMSTLLEGRGTVRVQVRRQNSHRRGPKSAV
ncbi:Rieske (2Fe-2S) protein [Pseudophaeobacter flagellatus]|nr:hypothetical protein [Pseudophaeobacter flagellatus]MCD9148335.1 hypothetical protein [Pseudophaeobacter flagellatus]